MNYFGFRKIAGKGKMAACSYVNEYAKEDISSLLFIKRKKTGVSSAAAKLMAQQNRINRGLMGGLDGMPGGMIGANSMGGLGGMGSIGGMGGGLSTASATMALNNYNSMLNGVSGMASAPAPTAPVPSYNDQASSLLRDQQSVLAQLQQAHASALTNPMPPQTQGGAPSAAPAAQNKLGGLGMGGAGTGLLTNDQGGVYGMSSSNAGNWAGGSVQNNWGNTTDAAAAQSLLMQQMGAGAASYSQGGMGGMPSSGSSDNLVRLDSAANLRALINQQISMFNTDPFAPSSSISALGGSMGSSIQTSGMAQGPAPSQQAGAPSGMGNASQGLSYEWNDILQRGLAGVGDAPGPVGADSVSLRQFEQQILQGNGNAGAPSSGTPMGQSFNFNGIFTGGAGGAPQGYQ